jgi:hypothetical protein
LGDAAGDHEWLFDFFGFDHHGDEGALGGVDNCAGVDEDEICLVDAINKMIAVLNKLAHHELAVGDVMRAAEGFHKNIVSSRCFFDNRLLHQFLFLRHCGFGVLFVLLFLEGFFLAGGSRLFVIEIEEIGCDVFKVVNFGAGHQSCL